MQNATRAYFPAIDGLRALAVLSVIIFHADFFDILPGGYTGVDMFFVISGFVISQSLSEQGNLRLTAFLSDFYRRRLLRILPALVVVLIVSFVVSAMFMPKFWLSELISSTGLLAFFGLSNFVLAWNTDTYFSPTGELNPYLHTWSLAIEEQFYLIFPALFYAWLRYRHRSPTARAMLPLLAIASLTVSALQTSAHPASAYYLLPGRFWELAAGALLFQLISTGRLPAPLKARGPLLLPIGLALVMVGALFAARHQFPFPWALVTVLGTSLMITAVVLPSDGPTPMLQRLLQCSPLSYIGRLSYSLYLWHWPVLVFLRWTTGLELLAVQLLYPFVVLALAAASYHWIETPFRTTRSLGRRRPSTIAMASIAVLCTLWMCAQWVSDNTERLSLSKTSNAYEWYAYRHYPRENFTTIDEPALDARQLFVIGDSHAAAYRTMLNMVRLQLGITVLEYETGGCGVVRLTGPDPASCRERQNANIREIEAQARPGDIVFLASLRMPELHGRDWTRSEDTVLEEVLSELTQENLGDAKASAKTILARLEAKQVHILIDAPKPLFKAHPNRCSDWFNKMNPICTPGLTMAREQLERLRAPQMQLLSSLQREHPNLAVWDPFPTLCPGDICSAYDSHGAPLFFDSNHLSGHANRVLTPSFSAALLAIWRNSKFVRPQYSPNVL
jgi:peptidoglycan/LPS O-acetylase OafA/YrhL